MKIQRILWKLPLCFTQPRGFKVTCPHAMPAIPLGAECSCWVFTNLAYAWFREQVHVYTLVATACSLRISSVALCPAMRKISEVLQPKKR